MTAGRSVTSSLPVALRALIAILALLYAAPVLAQDTPFIPDSEKLGRVEDKGALRYCIDPRDPEWPLAEEIGTAIANALLLEPKEVKLTDAFVTSGWEPLYRHFLTDCDIYFGFKLIPSGYPHWMALSRPYYDASYVLVVKDPNWQSLADIPTDRPIGSALATTADFAFVKYLEALPSNKRWPRFPMGNSQATMESLMKGTVAAALVWGPAAWALKQSDPTYADVRFISPAPLAVTTLGVGAAMLANETFMRTSVDQAIAALTADGTIDGIIKAHAFPATTEK
jgi:polar amino acid transport system substrate-binding protein